MPTVDLSFELAGSEIPLNHGYALFSALCRIVPDLHGDQMVGVHPIRGRRSKPGFLTLSEDSRLRLRIPSERIAPFIALSGRSLDLDGRRVDVRIPRVDDLTPAPNLASRMVTFRHSLDLERFLSVVHRDLEKVGVSGTATLVPSPGQPDAPIRRVLAIKGRKIVGYALRVTELSAGESLILQEAGLGGRRRMGCGLFTPFSPR